MRSPFYEDLALNEQGKLSSTQRASLESLFIARRRQMLLLLIWSAVVGSASFYGILRITSQTPMLLASVVLMCLLMVFLLGYSSIQLRGNTRTHRNARTARVEKIRGMVYKFDFRMPVTIAVKRAVTLRQGIPLKSGYLQIADESYGILPGPLYDVLPRSKELTCYYIQTGGPGLMEKIVVNFSEDI